jgi:DNA repair exonuclease SbcCD ATPase subunit
MASSSGCVASVGERRTEEALKVATEVAKIIREERNARRVFTYAFTYVKGFKELYALKGTLVDRALDRFTMAYNADVKHWRTCGHGKEFEGARFSRYRTKLNALAPVVTEYVAREEIEEEPTEESSEYDEEDVKDDLERLSTKRERLHKELQETHKELDRLNEKKVRHEARKRLKEIEAEEEKLAKDKERLKELLAKR